MSFREKTIIAILFLIARIIAAGIEEFDTSIAQEIRNLATHISVNARTLDG